MDSFPSPANDSRARPMRQPQVTHPRSLRFRVTDTPELIDIAETRPTDLAVLITSFSPRPAALP